MPSLSQICECISSNPAAASPYVTPLLHACQSVREHIDDAPLPHATLETGFDSAWEIVYREHGLS